MPTVMLDDKDLDQEKGIQYKKWDAQPERDLQAEIDHDPKPNEWEKGGQDLYNCFFIIGHLVLGDDLFPIR